MGFGEEKRHERRRRKLETTDKARNFEFIAYIPRKTLIGSILDTCQQYTSRCQHSRYNCVVPENIHTPPPPHGWSMEIPRGWGG